jgi:hypothetical protein
MLSLIVLLVVNSFCDGFASITRFTCRPMKHPEPTYNTTKFAATILQFPRRDGMCCPVKCFDWLSYCRTLAELNVNVGDKVEAGQF